MRKSNRRAILSRRLRSTQGAIDLASIMVGVIVIAIIGAGIFATLSSVIPWAQDNTAKQSLLNISQAQSVARVKDGKYLDTAALIAGRYLPANAGTSAKTATNADGTCFVAATKSQTGNIQYLTSEDLTPRPTGTSTPDTSACAPFPMPIAPAGPQIGDAKATVLALSTATWDDTAATFTVFFKVANTCGTNATSGTWRAQYSFDGSAWKNFTTPQADAAVVGGRGNSWTGTISGNDLTNALGKTAQFRSFSTCTATGFPDKQTGATLPYTFAFDRSFMAQSPQWSVDASAAPTYRPTATNSNTCKPGWNSGFTSDQVALYDGAGAQLATIPFISGDSYSTAAYPTTVKQVFVRNGACRLVEASSTITTTYLNNLTALTLG